MTDAQQLAAWWEARWRASANEESSVDWDAAARRADDIVAMLGLAHGQHILDVACGAGTVDIELAVRGFAVTGLDISPGALEIAREQADPRGVQVRWLCSDMRDLPPGPFDAILLWDVIFGVLVDDVENGRILDAVTRALRPGGRFYLEVYTKEFALRHGIEGRLTYCPQTDTFLARDGSRIPSMRLYARETLLDMLQTRGFQVIAERNWSWPKDPPGPPYRGWVLACTFERTALPSR
jgi:cyclopropane fatty-acyl-phospholipid synthase-like methyltransferase